MRRELLLSKEALQRVESEKELFRGKFEEAEARVNELGDLLNMELQKGYENE